jgi:hypothetical protein
MGTILCELCRSVPPSKLGPSIRVEGCTIGICDGQNMTQSNSAQSQVAAEAGMTHLTNRTDRTLARTALAILITAASVMAAHAENDSQSASTIMQGCNAWIASLSRGGAALGSNVFVAGECLGIVGTILYFSRDFSFSSAACPPGNVPYNQAMQVVTAYINARPQRMQELALLAAPL